MATAVAVSKITSKDQITVPKAVRETLGLKPGDSIAWEKDGDVVKVKRVSRNWLYEFCRDHPIRAGKGVGRDFFKRLREEWDE